MKELREKNSMKLKEREKEGVEKGMDIGQMDIEGGGGVALLELMDAITMCPRIMCPRTKRKVSDVPSLEQCIPWTTLPFIGAGQRVPCPLDVTSLTDMSRPCTASRYLSRQSQFFRALNPVAANILGTICLILWRQLKKVLVEPFVLLNC